MNQLIEQGRALAKGGFVMESLAIYDLAKQRDVEDPRAYIYSARVLLEAGRLEDARNEIQQVSDLEILKASDALESARILDKLGGLDKATDILEPFSSDGSLDREGLYLLADLYYRQRRTDEALAALEKYRKRSPGNRRIDVLRGEIYLMAEDYPKARSSFQEAVLDDMSNAKAQHGLGKAMWLQDGTSECKDPLKRAVVLEPENGDYLHILGIVCFKLDQQEEAISYLKRATETKDAPSQVFFDLGNAYRKAGMREEARAALAEYQRLYDIEREKDDQRRKIDQLMNQAQNQIDSGSILEAVQSYLRVVEADPNQWKAHSFLAKVYISSNRGMSALPHIEKMLEIAPENSEGSFLMAAYLVGLSRFSQAQEYAEKSRGLLPGNPQLRNLLGNIYMSLGKEDEARREYRAATKLEPDNVAFQMNLKSVTK